MEFITINRKENYTIIAMKRGKSNPINQQFVTEFNQTLFEILEDEDILGAVIVGQDNFFSAGLDIPELYQYNGAEFNKFWRSFMHLILSISKFNKPLVAAITGHAPAGGCIIANGCDYRVMADGNYKIGLNEIPVGIVVPRGVYAQYSVWLGERNAYQYLMEGKLYSPSHAKEIGLVDEVVALGQVLEVAENKLKQYLQYEQNGWRMTKAQLRNNVIKIMESMSEEEMNIFQQQWWSNPVRNMMQTFIEKLKK
jgi:3,2-trans-enoyl-CoA isomerase